jgi:hypothetical protein
VKKYKDFLRGLARRPGGRFLRVLGTALACASQTTGLAFVVVRPTDQTLPAVASNGNDYLVAWGDLTGSPRYASSIFATRISSSGVVIDPAFIGPLILYHFSSPFSAVTPSAASNGRDYLLAWKDSEFAGEYSFDGISGAIVTHDGIATNVFGIWGTDAFPHPSSPAVASCGDNYLVAWGNPAWGISPAYGIRGRLATSSGALDLDSAISPVGDSPKIAGGSTNFFVVWQAGGDVFGAIVNTNGAVSGRIPISTGPWEEAAPSVAYANDEFFVVWEDNRNDVNTSFDIYGARVSTAGVLLDTNGIPISTQPSFEGNPNVASDGSGFLVVWLDQDLTTGAAKLFGTHVSDAGAVLDSNRTAIASLAGSETSPAVACNGTNYLVVWSDTNGVTGQNIFGAQVGTFVPGLRLSGISLDTNGVALSWNAIAGKTYRVQSTTDLSSSGWADIPGDVVATNNVASKVDDAGANFPQRFYRVILLPSP